MKMSPKRKGLLALMLDHEREHPGFPIYLSGLTDVELDKYGLTVYDKVTLTTAVKAGLIKYDDNGPNCFSRLTDAGRQAILTVLKGGDK